MFEEIAHSIETKLVETSMPSAAVAIAKDGEIIWERGFGWADRERRIPATEHTMYSLASISKPITTTGLMILVEKGLVDLDKLVNEYLGDTKLRAWLGEDAQPTVRQVADHTSGLPLHYHFFFRDEPFTPPPFAETLRRYGNLFWLPGERYQYSNLAYGVLDYIIARIAKKSYTQFMREEVFVPLGLTRTSIDIGPGLDDYAATRYYPSGEPVTFYDFDHPGASAAFSSAHDLIRFGMFHLKNHLADQKAILTDESIDKMHVASAKSSPEAGYGLGWGSRADDCGYAIVAHSGGMEGVATQLTLVPSENLAVTVLGNAAQSLPYTLVPEILGHLLPGYAEKRAVKDAEAKEKEANPPPPTPFEPPAEYLGEWKGMVHTYGDDVPITLNFKESGDVHARLGEQLWGLVNDAKIEDGDFVGRMIGDLGVDDPGRYPYTIHLHLKHRGEAVNGTAIAISNPRPKGGSALSFWTELKR